MHEDIEKSIAFLDHLDIEEEI